MISRFPAAANSGQYVATLSSRSNSPRACATVIAAAAIPFEAEKTRASVPSAHGSSVSETAVSTPQIDDLDPAMIDRARRAPFAPLPEIPLEFPEDRLEPGGHEPLDGDPVHAADSSRCSCSCDGVAPCPVGESPAAAPDSIRVAAEPPMARACLRVIRGIEHASLRDASTTAPDRLAAHGDRERQVRAGAIRRIVSGRIALPAGSDSKPRGTRDLERASIRGVTSGWRWLDAYESGRRGETMWTSSCAPEFGGHLGRAFEGGPESRG